MVPMSRSMFLGKLPINFGQRSSDCIVLIFRCCHLPIVKSNMVIENGLLTSDPDGSHKA